MIAFRQISLQDGVVATVPVDLELVEATNSPVPLHQRHALISLRWRERYMQRVPEPYRAFFRFALPHLRARTTDVHTATSTEFVPELLAGERMSVNETVVYAALILHDSGWSRVSEPEIVASLAGRDVRHSDAPKQEPHDIFGAAIARQILPASPLADQLGPEGRRFVEELVAHHTWGDRYRPQGRHIVEMDLLCDADRLWSYTRENFWQDIVRKRVAVRAYIEGIERAIPAYFVTATGKTIAHRLWLERSKEVSVYDSYSSTKVILDKNS